MNILISFLSFLWILRIVINVVSWTSLWWIKEYRMDRMRIHLKTKQGRAILFPSLRLPPRSFRSISIIALSISILFGVWQGLGHTLVSLIVVDLISFPLVALVVVLSHIPIGLYHSWRIHEAIRRIRLRPDLLVIGITGSFGKTSTKEYLSTILSDSVATLKTEASKNSPIGIAEIILKHLKPQHKVFVVEMGAYKLGEIRAMCRIVRPQIGIILAINPQHQDLFGTIETTMKAKYELIESLTGKNIAILNHDDARLRTLSQWASDDGHSIWWITKHPLKEAQSDIFRIVDIESTKSRLHFGVLYEDTTHAVSVPIIGTHQATNITAAIAAAVAAQIPIQKAIHATRLLQSVPHVLEIKAGIAGSTYIDDTFNNNPDAAKAAIVVLGMYKKRKLLVFQPMIELGTYAQSSHYDVGSLAGQVCDEVILVGEDWSGDFINGVRSAQTNCIVQVLSVDKAASYLRTHIQSRDTVLFKGKSAGLVLSYIGTR